MIFSRSSNDDEVGGPFRFRVSDALDVPLRGYLLRLRLLEGRPDIDDLSPGSRLLLRSPDGEERQVRVEDFSTTGGRQTQERLDRYGELDIMISNDDALGEDGRAIDIGWIVLRPD